MRIGSIGTYGTSAYGIGFSLAEYYGNAGALGAGAVDAAGAMQGAGATDEAAQGVKGTAKVECQTCKERKYMDGSDENVSFKAASHISPEAAGARVRGHEAEHVANAYSKAEQKGGTVVNASVSIHTAVCPECGRTYVSGGTTTTSIRYNESNPYGKNQKSLDRAALVGGKMDFKL